MPSNPQQLHEVFKVIGRRLTESMRLEALAQREALELLHTCAAQPPAFRNAAERAASVDPALRCAVPLDENPARGYAKTTSLAPHTILAVDGSQAYPDRHEEILFAIVNIGAVTMQMGSGAAPAIDVETTLLFGDDLFPGGGTLLSEGDIALRRDAAERAALLRWGTSASGPSIALIDGPLELWGAKDAVTSESYATILESYLRNLHEMEQRGWLAAGYVDRPGADLVIRLLEVWKAAPQEHGGLGRYHPLRLCSDRWLFGQVLGPGERSAIFQLSSSSRTRYTDSLSLHFFYLNAGSDGHPAIARVEIPLWVAKDVNYIELLHGALLDQCRVLGSRPYPYVLHRAHEVSSLSPAEIEQIKLRLLLELRNHGIQPEERSSKSSAKAASAAKGGA
jgi:hypothetical protein